MRYVKYTMAHRPWSSAAIAAGCFFRGRWVVEIEECVKEIVV